MSRMKTQSQLISAIGDLNEELALKLIRERLAENDDPLTLIENCQKGLQRWVNAMLSINTIYLA